MSAMMRVIEQAGWVGWLLVAVSVLLWLSAVRRLIGLRRGFDGPLESFVGATLSRPADAHEHPDAPRLGGLVWFVVQGAHIVQVHPEAAHRLDALASRASQQLDVGRSLLRALVVAAPLLGLLGTVSGMIETFGSLHGGALVATAAGKGSVAGGISTALISTQLGLAIGIPGLIASRLLERAEGSRRREIYQARALLAQQVVNGGAA